jgi:type IX secretion system PorP/SprF family membrane protein
MKKIFCFLFFYIIAILAAIAQQDPQFSFNRYTQLTVNPGFAGNDGLTSGTILNRYQWDGFKGAPKTLVFSAGTATNLFGLNSGVGLNVISDELGFLKNISVNLNYAYRMKTSLGDLGIGLGVGIYNMAIVLGDGGWYIPVVPYFDTTSDDGIPQADASQIALDLNFGLYLKSNDYFAGISATHLNEPTILFDETARAYLARHYYLCAGYNIKLTNPLFELQPAIFVKTDGAAMQSDFTVDLVYKKKFSGGLNYRLDDAISILVGLEMNNGLRIGYAYDIITSAIAGYSGGSHEFYLNYSFDFGKNRNKKYKSVRYL